MIILFFVKLIFTNKVLDLKIPFGLKTLLFGRLAVCCCGELYGNLWGEIPNEFYKIMQKRKLQVFVSSTYLDLKEERQTAVQAILNAGHIPAGMELFTAGDESQWTIIKRWIEESDVYMLLLGGRYGSIEPKSGKSYTHLEYDYAVELGKPLFAIVTSDKALDEKVNKVGKNVLELDNPQGLKDFKRVVVSNMCAFWDDLKDIKLNINDSIRDIEYRYGDNLKGWVKADDTDYSSISEELARLSKENSELKNTIIKLSNEDKINGKLPSNWVELLVEGEIKSEIRYVIRDDKVYSTKNHLELLMVIGENGTFSKTNNYIKEIRALKNFNFLSSDGNLTDKGLQIFLYVKEQQINWQSIAIRNGKLNKDNNFLIR